MKKIKMFNLILLFLFFILSLFTIYTLFNYNIFPFYNLNSVISIVVISMLIVISSFVIKNKLKVFSFIVNIFMIIFCSFILYYSYYIVNIIEKININSQITNYTMSVVVLKDSNYNTIEDVAKETITAPIKTDENNITELLNNIKKEKNLEFELIEGSSYVKSYNSLIDKKTNVIILNSGYEHILELNDSEYKNKIKKIYEFKISRTVKKENKNINHNAFNIYISGIDTYGDITEVSRSDVNIIMTINKDTNKILLTTTPRDVYVKIADGGNNEYDKLTHAGVYGVNSSIHTLENLYDTKIDYYTRINFTSFLKLIDLVGGVEVYNEQAFISTHGNYNFPVGMVHLDSEKALGFVRERYSLASGDNDRGKNQQKVITAIIKKITKLDSITNYKTIIDEISNSIQTDMPINTIMSLANEQLIEKSEYNVNSQALSGIGELGLPSYMMPGYNLYMIKIDEDSLTETKKNIKDTLEGK